jgi:hypothetical protein
MSHLNVAMLGNSTINVTEPRFFFISDHSIAALALELCLLLYTVLGKAIKFFPDV